MKYKNDSGTNLADYQVKNIATMARDRLIQINSLCACNENVAKIIINKYDALTSDKRRWIDPRWLIASRKNAKGREQRSL